jgi:hypothetical protein
MMKKRTQFVNNFLKQVAQGRWGTYNFLGELGFLEELP